MTTPALVSAVYEKSQANISEFRKIVNRPLTLSEKILIGHLVGINKTEPGSGISYVFLQPDRVALQDDYSSIYAGRPKKNCSSNHSSL